MAHGQIRVGGRFVPYGFSSVEDWFDSVILSFPCPWTIGSEKLYGTEIFDARERRVLSVWWPFGEPSARQKGTMSDAEWREYCCDSHWESETQWYIANAVIAARNSLAETADHYHADTALKLLRSIIMQHGRWDEQVNSEIICGGPNRRRSDDDPQIRKWLGSKT